MMSEKTPYELLPPNKFFNMTLEERRCHLLGLLLLEAPKKTSVNQLAEYYYISSTSIVNDLKYIKDKLENCQLKLVHAHAGTYIDGSEENIRKLLMKVLGNSFQFFKENEHINQATYNCLFKAFSQADILSVENILGEIEQLLGEDIREPYYINIFTHLLILIKRLHHCKYSLADEAATIGRLKLESSVVWEIAKTVVQKIADYLKAEVPPIEVFYIYQHLISSRIEGDKVSGIKMVNNSRSEEKFAAAMIKSLSEKLQVPFFEDENLQYSLLLHIQPLAKRLQYKIAICNPLLAEIKKEFPEIFQAVSQAIHEQILFPEFSVISEDEIGYIAVYFQAALEKKRQHKKILIVCSSGIGTSHLLGARVKRVFPDWEITDIVSASKVQAAVSEKVPDLILTTVHLQKQEVPTVLVSAVFSELDVLQIKNMFLAQSSIGGEKRYGNRTDFK